MPVLIWYLDDIVLSLQLAAVPAALTLAWRWPLGIALAFISISCFRFHDAFPSLQPLRLPIALGGLLIITAAFHIFARNVSIFLRRESILMFLFLLHVTIGMMFAVDRQTAYDGWS